MTEGIGERVLEEGRYILKQSGTVRMAAQAFGVSKSTVHKDLTERLPKADAALYEQVRRVMEINKAERHLRGGEATQRKFRGEEKLTIK